VKLVLFCLLAGVLPAVGETRWAPSAPITLYTNFQQQTPSAVFQALQEEVETIMAPIGLHFEWRSLSGVGGHEVSAELAVVTFQGRCEPSDAAVRARFSGALGWTHVSDGEILPFTDIACDRIREFVQRSLMMINPEDRQEVYGRALGRVLAHELYHIFANTAHHASSGVAKECYSVQDLINEEFHFEQKETRLLRAKRPPAAAEPDTAESTSATH
jgi:hypothetical protein